MTSICVLLLVLMVFPFAVEMQYVDGHFFPVTDPSAKPTGNSTTLFTSATTELPTYGTTELAASATTELQTDSTHQFNQTLIKEDFASKEICSCSPFGNF